MTARETPPRTSPATPPVHRPRARRQGAAAAAMAACDLEERIAHLIRAVDDLSDELVRRGAEIDRLSRQVALLLAREAEREAEAQRQAPVDRPPHW
jgi:SlyX protein